LSVLRCDAMSWGRVAPDLCCGLINTHGFFNPGVAASHCWNYLAVMEWNYAAKSRAFSCPLAIFAHYKSSKLFSPEKKQYSISASTREKWAQFSHWAFSLISIVCIIWSI